MPHTFRAWTQAEVDQLRRLAQQQLSVEAIAATLNRSVEGIRSKAAHRRIPLVPRQHSGGPRRQLPWDPRG